MDVLVAKVVNGRLTLDEPTELPEGTEVALIPDDVDEADELDEEDRARLHAAIGRSIEQLRAGQGRSFPEVLEELKRRRP